MTDFHVECVRVGKIDKHPNADTLGITHVGDYPVIVKLDDFKEGDLAVYVPVDAIVPNKPEWAFLGGHFRIKAKRLRGVFSQGLLMPAPLGVLEGEDCAVLLEIEKYETPEEKAERSGGGPNNPRPRAAVPASLPRYTDLENVRRWPNALREGEDVVITEKIEGENCGVTYERFPWWKRAWNWFWCEPMGRTIVRSRNQLKTEGKWVEVTASIDFEQLPDPERYSIYGESYGYTAGFNYGKRNIPRFAMFDAWDRKEKRWCNWQEVAALSSLLDLDLVPILHWGPWSRDLLNLAEGESEWDSHVREGFVVRPENERTEPGLGRVILKCKGEGYLFRKEAA